MKDRGQSFAEGALFIDNLRYPVNARAIRKSTLLAFDKACLGALLCGSTELSRRLIATMHRSIQSLMRQVETMAFQNATQRLVGYLLRQELDVDSWQITLSMPKHVLAA